MNVIPRDRNGRVDWLGYIRTTWPILVAVLLAWGLTERRLTQLEVAGKAETPSQKSERIRLICGEMISQRVPPPSVTQRLDRIEARLLAHDEILMQILRQVDR